MRIFLFLVFFLSSFQALAFDHGYSKFDQLLKLTVVEYSEGKRSRVNYRKVKKHEALLRDFLKELAEVGQEEFEGWNEPQQLAFLINSYNAFVLKMVYPEGIRLSSIKDIGGLFNNPMNDEVSPLLGARRSLDEIQHEMIRKHFNEPLTHFALAPGSLSGPPLRSEPYLPERLKEQLEDNTKRFMTDRGMNLFDLRYRFIHISSIFKWYKEDFEGYDGGVRGFVSKYLAEFEEDLEAIRSKEIHLTFKSYNWNLNYTSD